MPNHASGIDKALWLLTTVIFYGSVGYSQNIISGKVLGKKTGESLPFATVKIERLSKGGVTNLDGFLTILDIASFPVRIEVSYVGFQTTAIVH